MKTKVFISAILGAFLLINCHESEDLNTVNKGLKKSVTIENIGDIHNELLAAYFASQTRGTTVPANDISTYYDAFKEELFTSGKYEISGQQVALCETSISDFEDVMSLEIDSAFYENSLDLVLDRIKNNNGICDEVKHILYEITDENCTLSSYELSLLAEKYKSYVGGEYLVVYSNIFKSSSDYWQPVTTRNSDNRKVIAADCLGGLLGLTCCGAMSVIWGAAFSYSLDKCLDPSTVTVDTSDSTSSEVDDSTEETSTAVYNGDDETLNI